MLASFISFSHTAALCAN